MTMKERITPAHAGKSKKPLFDVDTTGDHPRTCGEKFLFFLSLILILGSPPHMRGKETSSSETVITERITPAHAGKSFLFSYLLS